MKKIKNLTASELYFVYCVLSKYDDQYDPEIQKKKSRGPQKKKVPPSFKEQGIPNLYNINDKSWDTCKDEHLLMYKIIMEKAECDA